MFIILISVIVSQVHTYVKMIKLYTTNMCSLFMLLYLIKVVLKVNQCNLSPLQNQERIRMIISTDLDI